MHDSCCSSLPRRLCCDFTAMIGESSSPSSSTSTIDASESENSSDYLALIAELTLQDIDDISASRKGKGNALAPKSDDEFAFDLLAEEARSMLFLARDMAFAQSLDDALQADYEILQEASRADEVARCDREYALALQEGRPPPSTRMESDVAVPVVDSSPSTPISPNWSITSTPAIASSSKTRLRSTTNAPSAGRKKEMCAFCRDTINGLQIHVPCGHFWDVDCLVELFRAATTDETLFPPRCCQQPISLDAVQQHLGVALLATFNMVSIEYSTTDRVYCHRPTCSAFICPATESPSNLACPKCFESTCGRCKEQAHPGTPCTTDDAPILAMAEQEGWARCPGCRHLVELTIGCYHISCRCGKQFCYICTEIWKTCGCPQWDEPRLLDHARDRVRRELQAGHPGALPPAPQYEEMVHQAAERLRVDHHCQHSRWRYRSGGGHCENCSHYLPVFLLSCRHCHMNVCVRCRRNRL